MKGERGQITLFFIIGLVLLFTAALLYLFLGKEEPVTKLDVANAQLNSYLGTCVDTAVEEEFADLGNYSGRAKPLGGEYLYGIKRKVPGAIVPIGPQAYPVPQYPDWDVTLANTEINSDGSAFHSYQDGYFGDVQFLAPCSRTAGNPPLSAFSCRYYPGMPPGTPTGVATQDLAMNALQTSLQGCANIGIFQRTIGVDNVEAPTVNVTFTDAAVIVDLRYMVTINGEKRELPLQRTYPLRYRTIAEFAYDLARKETRDVTFQIDRDYKNIPSYRPGISVTRVHDAVQGADLIVITDTDSRLRNAPYSFKFLVEHRAPMIDPDATACSDFLFADPDEKPVECTENGDLVKVVVTGEPALFDCMNTAMHYGFSCS